MSDVAMHHTADGGEISIVNGQPEMSDGLFNAVYLSLFGGNEDDGGTDATKDRQWWGNVEESDPSARLRSETQYILRNMPATSANLRLLEDAIVRDLNWMLDSKLASLVASSASIPKANAVDIDIDVEIDGRTTKFKIQQPWVNR